VGATGDLSRRKLLPGLFYLSSAGFIPNCRIIGVSLDQIDADGLRKIAREALGQFSSRTVKDADWAAFAETLDYVPIGAGADALKAAAAEAERKLGNENGALALSQRAAQCRLVGRTPVGGGGPRRPLPDHHGKAVRNRPEKRGRAERQAARGLF
jgi:hypothetical protein